MKLGLVGCGHVSGRYGEILTQENAPFELSVVFDKDADAAQRFSAKYGAASTPSWEDFLASDTDIICICTPNFLHASHAIDALKAGKHVLIEHPLATNLQDGEKILQIAAEQNKRVFVVRQRRFMHAIQIMKALLDTGLLGQPSYIKAELLWSRRPEYFTEQVWRSTPENGGVILNQASHFLDLLIYLFGEPLDCYGALGNVRHKLPIEDAAQATLVFANHASATVSMTTASPDGLNASILEVVFEGRVIRLTGKEWDVVEGLTAGEMTELENAASSAFTGDHGGYINRVASALAGEATDLVEGIEGLKATRLIETMYANFQRDDHGLSQTFNNMFAKALA